MIIRTDIPQIAVLRNITERKFGTPLQTHNAFAALADAIEKEIREHLSESTLQRVWGYSTRIGKVVSSRTLDVLARYTGVASWKEFCRIAEELSPRESKEFSGEGSVDVRSLEPGAKLELSWLPDRTIIIRYLGDCRFEVLESLNSSLQPGDSFACLAIQKGVELYLDRLIRAGESRSAGRYVVGEKHGLSSVEIIQ